MSERDMAPKESPGFVLMRAWKPSLAGATLHAAGDDAMGRASCRIGDAGYVSAHAAALGRSAGGQGPSLHRSLLDLQRRYGNHHVGQVLRQAGAIGPAGDGMETIERAIEQARGGGQGMDHGTRNRMEAAFGADFAGVRIHTDTRADRLSEALSARAFTTGQDVFFRQGEYDPGSSAGRELLAHELTHVVQQNGDGVQRRMTVSEPGDAQEVEAERVAQAVIRQEHAPLPGADYQVAGRQGREEDEAVARREAAAVQRQPEALSDEDEEKKALHMKAGRPGLARQADGDLAE